MNSAGLKIYCVVAATVQTPLDYDGRGYPRPTPLTRHIVQPAGRQIAQACHAVSLVRMAAIKAAVEAQKPYSWQGLMQPTTTIILQARDSYELVHVKALVNHNTFTFTDSGQPDYGDMNTEIVTAFATEPLVRDQIVGALDHLPLWRPE